MQTTKSLSFTRYLPPSPVPSPLALFDAYEMADSIRRVMTDAAIVADIAHIDMSGQDFLNLRPTDLRTLSRNNEKVYQELRKLQRIPPDVDHLLLTRYPSIEDGFPELKFLIHSRQPPSRPERFSTGANSMGIPDGDDVSPPQAADTGVTTLQDDLDHSLQPDASVELQTICDDPIAPTMTFHADEASIDRPDEPKLANSLDSQPADRLEENTSFPQNDSILAGPDLPVHHHGTPDTRSSSPGLSYVDEDNRDTVTQHTPVNLNMLWEQDRLPTTARNSSPTLELALQSTSNSSEEFQMENPLLQTLIDSQTVMTEDGGALEQPAATLSTLPSGLGYPPSNLPPFSKILYVPDLKPYNPINDMHFNVGEASSGETFETPQSSNDSEEAVDRADHSLRYLNRRSDDFVMIKFCPQPSPSSASTDETLEDPVAEVSLNLSPSCSSNPTRLEVDLDERFNVDMSIPVTPTHGSAITRTANILPLIPVTPSDSPIFEGLSQYMTLDNSPVSGVLRENSAVDLDKAPTPVQHEISTRERTLWPPSEIPCIRLFSSTSQSLRSRPTSKSLEPSGKSKSAQRPDIDAIVQRDLCPELSSCIQMRASCLGKSNFERMQLILRAIPALFALNRETINRATSDS